MNNYENERNRRQTRPALIALAAVTLLATVVLVPRLGDAQEELDPAKIQDTRDAFAQWAETRRTISKSKSAWKLEKEILADQIELRKDDIAGIRERIDETKKSIEATERAKKELIAKRDALRLDAKEFERVVDELEPRILTLIERFPAPLKELVAKAAQSIPRNDEEKKAMGLGQRYANLATVMIKANKFNREVKIETETRDLENGTSVSVQALYFGLGQAYYASQNGDVGGVGSANESGWVWSARNDAAPRIARAIAMKQNKEPASFIELPVLIDGKEVTK